MSIFIRFFNITIRFGIELIILPFIAGIAYELLRLAGRFRSATFVNVLFSPGLASQYLTTREPEPRHVEVALAALKACIDAETANPTLKEPEPNALESAPLS